MNPIVKKLVAEKDAERRSEYEAAKAELAEKLHNIEQLLKKKE